MSAPSPRFEPWQHEAELVAIVDAIREEDELDPPALDRLLRRHPRGGRGVFSKNQLIRGFRALAPTYGWDDEAQFVERVRMKPVRTRSGVAPVTVLTKPFPCPGRCVFCPSDVRMPKSYLSREPGAQRAAQHRFDPFAQTLSRLAALHGNGHPVDKVELIVLGGTWSSYPEPYQVWFILRCFEALNAWTEGAGVALSEAGAENPDSSIDWQRLEAEIVGREVEAGATSPYNEVVSRFLRAQLGGHLRHREEAATWEELAAAQRINERARARCVGLVLETRPDCVDAAEVRRLRRLGATKVQVGVQNLADEVLLANRRGHDVATTRRALGLLRAAGFKLHVHWMPNLLGSDPELDRVDFGRLWSDPAIRPDELKVYPCSLLPSAELMRFHESGDWRPYTESELLELLVEALPQVPPYCRVTRVIRDIPGDEIVSGNRVTNFRQVVEGEIRRRGGRLREIRSREIGDATVTDEAWREEPIEYDTAIGGEIFFQALAGERLLGFCRLALPDGSVDAPFTELEGSALLREVHVYGRVTEIGDDGELRGRAQHRGVGRALVMSAARWAGRQGFRNLAVISSVGTREYYRALDFVDGELYQHLALPLASMSVPGRLGG